MDTVHKPSDSECYAQPLEPFTLFLFSIKFPRWTVPIY
jgi:hypothetical protein